MGDQFTMDFIYSFQMARLTWWAVRKAENKQAL
jgi:hypothetical protein